MGNSLKTNNGLFQRVVAGVAQMCLAGIFVLPAFGQSGAILTTLQTGISMSQAPLVQGSDGYFYGTGFTQPQGEVFKVGADGTLTHLHTFTDGANGSIPMGLVQGSDGYLYGVTTRGGTNNLGACIKLALVARSQICTRSPGAQMAEFPKRGWYREATGISTVQPGRAARTQTAQEQCSRLARMGR